ncbi:MAG: cysteine-rich KTR domain-containing protein [Lachnospiraceae bacterium]
MVNQWYRCPRCGNAHFIKIRPDTRIINFPAYCKWCKTESVITIEPKSQNSYSKVN